MMRKPWRALAVVAAGAAVGVWGLGELLQFVVVFWLVIAVVLAGLVAHAITGRAKVWAPLGAIVGGALLSLPIGCVTCRYEVNRALRYCDSLRPALERYRAETGAYPDNLEAIPSHPPLPRLLKGIDFYQRLGEGYRIEFSDPSRMFAGYTYESTSGYWNYWD
jgi:hypothetical protein